METNKVTSRALREMAIGETRTFDLENAEMINSGKAIAYRLGRVLRCRFTAESDFKNNRLTLTKTDRQ